MAKRVNITDKINFDASPVIIIKDVEITVNDDAETILQIMDLLSEKSDAKAAVAAYNLFFSEEERKKVAELKIPYNGLMVLIETAMDIIRGESEEK